MVVASSVFVSVPRNSRKPELAARRTRFIPSSKASSARGVEAGGALADTAGVGSGVEAGDAVDVAKIVGVIRTIEVGATVGAGVGVDIDTNAGCCRRHWKSR